jgi:hypothetical protein
MDAILGYNWQDLLKIYPIVCIMVGKPNRSRSIALSVVSGYPVGFV